MKELKNNLAYSFNQKKKILLEKIFCMKTGYMEILFKLTEKLNTDKLKVGLVWKGNPDHLYDYKRSCKLDNFKEILKNKNCTFFAPLNFYRYEFDDPYFVNYPPWGYSGILEGV